MLPDGSHQNIQDAFINLVPVLDPIRRDSADTPSSTLTPTPGTPLLLAAEKGNKTVEGHQKGSHPPGESSSAASSLSRSRRSSTTSNSSLRRRHKQQRHPTKDKLYALVAFKHMQRMNLQRNARVKSLMLIADTKACTYLKKVLYACLNEIFAIDFLEEDRSEEEKSLLIRDILRHLYTSILTLRFPAPDPRKDNRLFNSLDASLDIQSLCYTEALQKPLYTRMDLQFRGGAYPLKVCTSLPPNALDDTDISLVSLIDRFHEKIMLLFNCILFERKCVLLGHNLAASKVCSFVLAAALMIPVLSEKYHIRKRVFPYVSFGEMDDFLNTPAYIVGTTNPIFFERNEWYDCLCDVADGTIQITCPEQLVEISAEDQNFILKLMHRISQMKLDPSYTAARIEQDVQSHFRQYAQDIFRGALLMSRGVLPSLDTFDTMEWQKSKPRIMPKITKSFTFKTHLFQKTRSFRIYKKVLQKQKTPIGVDILEEVLLLRNSKTMEDVEIMEIYGKFLKNVKSRDQVLEFLTYFPAIRGGLDCLLQPLLHPNELIQFTVMTFLAQLEAVKEGELAIANSNLFLILTYNHAQTHLAEYTNAKVD